MLPDPGRGGVSEHDVQSDHKTRTAHFNLDSMRYHQII